MELDLLKRIGGLIGLAVSFYLLGWFFLAWQILFPRQAPPPVTLTYTTLYSPRVRPGLLCRDVRMTPQDQEFEDELKGYRPGLIAVLIIILLVLAMLATLVWPLLQSGDRRLPTPTPGVFQEA